MPERWRIKVIFFFKQGRFPNLKNPQSFNEKVQWRKIYDRREFFGQLVDKIEAKKHVNECAPWVKVPKTYWIGYTLDEFDTGAINPPYVIKANHASGTNIIINNTSDLPKDLRHIEKKWRKLDLSRTFVEWAYSTVPIRFFAEEFLDFDDFVPIDFKVWVFHGKAKFVEVDTDRFRGHKRAFYDRDWNRLAFLLTFPKVSDEIEKPKNFQSILDSAEAIAAGLDFARVDLYSDQVEVYFGEITLYPDAGHGTFHPTNYDFFVGKNWKLPYTE